MRSDMHRAPPTLDHAHCHFTSKGTAMTTFAHQVLGEYDLQELIGQGGMAEVYRASHPTHGIVAFKVLPAALMWSAEAQKRFQHEAAANRRLQHPHIVRLYEAGELPDPLNP